MGSNNLSITLKRSFIGRSERHKLVAKGLGLKKLNQTVLKPDTKEIRGMINKISYLLEVKEI